MKKLKILLMTIISLWLIAYFLSVVIKDQEEKFIGEGIAIVPIQGIISIGSGQDLLGGEVVGSDTILENLKKAYDNEDIKAVILEINSGGGEVVASREVANYVEKVREKKPVVAWIREVGASGAYWIASKADVIVADELSITGSIGVISSYLEYSGLMEKYGVKYERLVSGEYKDTGSEFKELNTEERRFLEDKLRKIQEIFVKEVAESRKLNSNQIIEIKKAQFYLGMEAKELGLVDVFGGREEAINQAKKLGKISDGNVIEFKTKKSIWELLNSFGGQAFFNMGRGLGFELVKKEGLKIETII